MTRAARPVLYIQGDMAVRYVCTSMSMSSASVSDHRTQAGVGCSRWHSTSSDGFAERNQRLSKEETQAAIGFDEDIIEWEDADAESPELEEGVEIVEYGTEGIEFSQVEPVTTVCEVYWQ
jgi:hypothetical protein